jgi:hypothetical protein
MKILKKKYIYFWFIPIFIFGLFLYLFLVYSYRNNEQKVKDYYSNEIGSAGEYLSWESVTRWEKSDLVKVKWDILNPIYAVIYYVGESSFDDDLYYTVDTFELERDGLFGFKVKYKNYTSVIEDLTFEEVVEMAKKDIRKQESDDIIWHYGRTTPESQEEKKKELEQEYEYSYHNPSNTDSLEWWESESGASNEYILVKSTGNKMLTAEELQMTRLPKNEDYLDKLFVWINDEQIIYGRRFNCMFETSAPGLMDKDSSGDAIILYDVPTDTHTKIIEYPEDTNNCLRDRIGLFEDEFIILREENIEKYDFEGNLLSTTILSKDLQNLADADSEIGWIKTLKYDGKTATLGYVNNDINNNEVFTETVELE